MSIKTPVIELYFIW